MGIKDFLSNLKPWQKGLAIGVGLDVIYALLYNFLSWHLFILNITSPFYNISLFFNISFVPIYGFSIYGLIIGLIITKLDKNDKDLVQKTEKKTVRKFSDKSKIKPIFIIISIFVILFVVIMFFRESDSFLSRIITLTFIVVIIWTINKLYGKIKDKKPFFEPSKSNLIFGVLSIINGISGVFMGISILFAIGFSGGINYFLIVRSVLFYQLLAYTMIFLSPVYFIIGITMILRYIKNRLT